MWKIYINFGWEEEFDITETQSFKTKKEACKWAKENGYPYKCVMREEEYNKRKESEEPLKFTI